MHLASSSWNFFYVQTVHILSVSAASNITLDAGCTFFIFLLFFAENVASFFSSTASHLALNPLEFNFVWYNRIRTVQVPTHSRSLFSWFWILCGCGIFLISSTAVTHLRPQLGITDPVNTAVFAFDMDPIPITNTFWQSFQLRTFLWIQVSLSAFCFFTLSKNMHAFVTFQ